MDANVVFFTLTSEDADADAEFNYYKSSDTFLLTLHEKLFNDLYR